MKPILILLCFCFSVPIFAQEIKAEEKLILNDTLVFLGMDFSTARMINAADEEKAILIREKHGHYWCMIDDFMCKNSNLKFDFEKKNVVCKASLFDSSYTKLDSNWVVEKYAGITEKEISRHVKSYPVMKDYKVGIVFIIDKLDKYKNALTMYGTYVNLSDNTVLKTIKCVGTPDGYGYGMYWATGVDMAYAHFVIDNQNYLHRIKHYFKKQAKSN